MTDRNRERQIEKDGKILNFWNNKACPISNRIFNNKTTKNVYLVIKQFIYVCT